MSAIKVKGEEPDPYFPADCEVEVSSPPTSIMKSFALDVATLLTSGLQLLEHPVVCPEFCADGIAEFPSNMVVWLAPDIPKAIKPKEFDALLETVMESEERALDAFA